MAIHEAREQDTHKHACFLCTLDSHPCTVPQLEGHIIAVHEFKGDGESTPTITINLGTEYASVSLTRYYRSLVKELIPLGSDLYKRKLKLRIYHLPPALHTTERNGRIVHRYRANDYTLAILEPDTILNITDLNQADYCSRQYLLNRLVSSTQSVAAIRGNLVHSSFKELLKEHDRGELMSGYTTRGEEMPLSALHRHFEQALQRSSIDLALINASSEEIRADVAPHLESLANWFQKQRTTLWDIPASHTDDEIDDADAPRSANLVRAETFLLAPEIGLRGRLDLLWQQNSRQRLLELKTGGADGDLPRSAHRWQVQGYLALLAVRQHPAMKKALATLLYSGAPGEAQDFGIRPTIKQLQRVIEQRNILALSHVTGLPPAPPGPSRCTKCTMLNHCEQVSSLLDWQPPKPDQTDTPHVNIGAQFIAPASVNENEIRGLDGRGAASTYTPRDKAFFARYYNLLHLEGLEGEKQQALLWQISVKERVERGTAIGDLEPMGKPVPTGQGEWQQAFRCTNTSELREGDEILLSDGDPITGEVVTGTILGISSELVTVWTPELITHPRLIDRYDTGIVHVRTLQNLLRWLQADSHMRGLVAGTRRPRFTTISVPAQPGLNDEQNLAVERAMQMQDYLLIHGPPGTGKTSVIAGIVKRLCQQGQRILLAAFTNQAVDNMLKRLDREGFHDYVRLGHDRSVDGAIQGRLLKRLIGEQPVREVLRGVPVVASTTATWSSEKYTPSAFNGDAHADSFLHFDVAIIDEAGQLTVPAILGALRFAKRFILVGDEKQLPPLVLSKTATESGLNDSLFALLKHRDYDYMKHHPEAISACVPLKVQYRMNKWISHFASKVFYDGQLTAHSSVANRVLAVATVSQGFPQEAPSITRALDPAHSLVFLDVRGEEERSKVSNQEARTVRELVAGLLARGIAEADIGIIAPYRAQVATLRRHLFSDDIGWRALQLDTPLTVDTVDRFQGGERPVIIISFATTVTPEAESQLREHLTNQNRLNVALTRAQRKLILVGNASALEALPIFQRLLNYCRGMQTVIAHAAHLAPAKLQ